MLSVPYPWSCCRVSAAKVRFAGVEEDEICHTHEVHCHLQKLSAEGSFLGAVASAAAEAAHVSTAERNKSTRDWIYMVLTCNVMV